MIIHEIITKDLFTVPHGYYLVNYISGDYVFAEGIAKKFDEVYNMKYKLQKNYEIADGNFFANVGKALLVDDVFNLVVKELCFHKPTYNNLYNTLLDMKEWCKIFSVTKLAMPIITSGSNQLDRYNIETLVKNVFKDMNIEIVLCSLI